MINHNNVHVHVHACTYAQYTSSIYMYVIYCRAMTFRQYTEATETTLVPTGHSWHSSARLNKTTSQLITHDNSTKATVKPYTVIIMLSKGFSGSCLSICQVCIYTCTIYTLNDVHVYKLANFTSLYMCMAPFYHTMDNLC